MSKVDISIVIPTWNRVELVERLLNSIENDKGDYEYGDIEVLVVDSSHGEEKQRIKEACRKYHAVYYEGDDSVRKKRNKGIKLARKPYILFLDSDVEVKKGLLNAHASTILKSTEENLGGTFGVTEFVGRKTFLWKIIEYTTFVDSFGFAKKFPYQNWTIGNNVMFRKEVLEEVGMFEENLPFRLGGDDLDLSYRITKKGYLIKSVKQAVTYHSRETWNNLQAVFNRAKRWGSMEYYLEKRHPEIFISRVPKTELIIVLWSIVQCAFSIYSKTLMSTMGFMVFLLITFFGIYILDTRNTEKKNFCYYFGAKIPEAVYYLFHIMESVKNKSLNGFYKCMSFSSDQTRYMLIRETKRVWIIMIALIANVLFDFWTI